VAASALLVDYVLTVAVSVAAGVANIVSAVPEIAPHAVALSLAFVALLAMMNLRGVRESGIVFAIPTYGFLASVFFMLAVGAYRAMTGVTPTAESAHFGITPDHHVSGLLLVALVLRAFASGCTALTGVEAVSNGVPNFKPPKSRNAASTLTIMGALTVTMFAGITALAMAAHVHIVDNTARLVGAPSGYEQRTVIAQLAGAVFGNHSLFFFAVQGFTAAILVLAANTAFSGFPILASILGGDGYLPRQFHRRGDRLVFSNGVLVLAALAGLLIYAFDASTTRLIQLYIIGVFVSFTLSQWGMVRHWTAELRSAVGRQRITVHRARFINGLGAVFTALVLVVVLLAKFTHGAYIVVIAMPAIFALMRGIKAHYDRVAIELRPAPGGVTLPGCARRAAPRVARRRGATNRRDQLVHRGPARPPRDDRRRRGTPHTDRMAPARSPRPPPGPARHATAAAAGGVGPYLRHRDKLSARVFVSAAPQARDRSHASSAHHHRAGRGISVRALRHDLVGAQRRSPHRK
jgi:amino acid transporter